MKMMNSAETAKSLDRAFYYILLGIFLLNSAMYLLVFLINWEAWFFGVKMNGLYAGIILFANFLISSSLAGLLFRYPKKIAIIAMIAIFFFGFKFMDSAATIQEVSGGQKLFNEFMAIVLVIPVVVLIGHLLIGRFYEKDEYMA